MSIEATVRAWRSDVADPVSRLVLIALADSSGGDGTTLLPDLDSIASLTRLPGAAVRNHLSHLEDAGYLISVDGGYQITPPAAAP